MNKAFESISWRSLWVYMLQYMASNHELAMHEHKIDKGYFKAVRNLLNQLRKLKKEMITLFIPIAPLQYYPGVLAAPDKIL